MKQKTDRNCLTKPKGYLCRVCLILVLIISFSGRLQGMAASAKGTVTAQNLNVRTGAGTGYRALQQNGKNVMLKKGTSVTVMKQKNGWYYISFQYNSNTCKGYVIKDYIQVKSGVKIPADTTAASGNSNASDTKTNTSSTSKKKMSSSGYTISGIVTADNLNVRTKADRTSTLLSKDGKKVLLKKNSKVTIKKEFLRGSDKWYQASFVYDKKTLTGYLISDYVKINAKNIPAQINANTAVKVKTAAGSKKPYAVDQKKIISLNNGQNVTILKEVATEDRKWYQISYNYGKVKKTGYVMSYYVLFKETAQKKPADDTNGQTVQNSKTAVITTDGLRVRTGAGTNYTQAVDENKNQLFLKTGDAVKILSQKKNGTELWYRISFPYKNKTMQGYVLSDYVKTTSGTNSKPDNTKQPDTNTDKDSSENKPDKNDSNNNIPDDNNGSNDETNVPNPDESQDTNEPDINTETPLNDAEFEQMLDEQGFPESYKPYLRNLHKTYPHWKFKAFQTGLDWNTAVANESKTGKNLIANSKNIAWKSTETGAYNWKTDTFIPYDGSSWVTASADAVKYYMDPRNFLNGEGIFQFELLTYQSDYQNQQGVENILKNTPLSNASYNYIDENTGETKSITYAETFIRAAEYSGVSPYHLASRVKQEVITGKTTMSSAAMGTVPGYEGYYNFYNIGASNSTQAGANIANGMKYAKSGSVSAITNALYLIPWNNQYKAIVGGSQFIGSSYIKKGQNTIYLQKFNVTPVSTYSHQYMANIEATKAEAVKTAAAYSSMMNYPIVFEIPVYSNMPEIACAAPANGQNPNNWLKSLNVSGFSLTPTFNTDNDESVIYNLIVPDNIQGVNISAVPVSSSATVSGTGYTAIEEGNNDIVITVTAENQSTRNYWIKIVKTAVGQ